MYKSRNADMQGIERTTSAISRLQYNGGPWTTRRMWRSAFNKLLHALGFQV